MSMTPGFHSASPEFHSASPEVEARRRRPNDTSPNRELLMMPCGCWALPSEIMHIFGENIYSFICDQHGESKVTQKWMKEAKNKVTAIKYQKIPSEYGYQVRSISQDCLTM